jgi:hypothetical protein
MPDYRTHFEKMGRFYGKVEILRPLLWFYVGQPNIKVEDLAKRFTNEAIFQLVNDKFITIEELDREGNVVKND